MKTGDSGEIWIGGDCLARGYVGRPELTAERFRLDPFRPGGRVYRTGDLGRLNDQGEIEFLGRLDQQVKIRGFRVEPSEIETVLCGHPAIAAAAVVAREITPGDKRLHAYIVAKAGQHVTTDELRKLTNERLPDFMVPAAFMTLPALPLTPSGKVDRGGCPRLCANDHHSPCHLSPHVRKPKRTSPPSGVRCCSSIPLGSTIHSSILAGTRSHSPESTFA